LKALKELTKQDGENIFKLFFKPDDGYFEKFSFEPIIDESGRQRITFGGGSIIGVCCRVGPMLDGSLIDFYNPKVMKYLYDNGFDISSLFDDLIEDYKETEEEAEKNAEIEFQNDDYRRAKMELKDYKEEVESFKKSFLYKIYKIFNKE
jgi:queuine/archaeosine tRNA-ribosyltransferase